MARKSKEQRRQEIIDAFKATMAEHGYAKATINRVADRASLTPGLLHYHFKNKQAILLALIDELVDAQVEGLQQIIEESPSAPAKCGALIDAFLAVGDEADPSAVAAWVSIAAEAVRQSEVRAAFTRAMSRFEGIFEEVIAAGAKSGDFDLQELSAPACAAALLATIQGYFTIAATAREVIPAGSAAAATRKMARGLLGTEAL